MKTYLSPILAVLLGIALTVIYMLWQDCRNEKQGRISDNAVLNSRLTVKDQQIIARDTLIETIRKSRTVDSLEAKSRERGFKTVISKLTRSVALARVPVSVMIDTTSLLKVFVQGQDSLLVAKDSLIAEMDSSAYNSALSYSREIGLLENQISDHVEKSALLSESINSAMEDTRKEKRRKKFWRTTAAICAGIALFLTVQK